MQPLFILVLGIAAACCGRAGAGEPPGWELVWSDEFDGGALDFTKWEFEVNADGGGNNELQYQGTNLTLAVGTFADDFHVFRLDWGPGIFRWYVDDRLYQTQTNWTWRRGEFPAPFDQPFHLLLNVAVGGYWPGKPDAATTFPQAMTVDYVRVYRRR